MRRLVCSLVLAVLPLQLSWAVASVFCSHHEQGEAAQHFGHHADEHEEHAAPTDEHQSTGGAPVDSPHCDDHHGATWAIDPPDVRTVDSLPLRRMLLEQDSCPSSAPRSRLERPKWAHFA